MIREKNTPEGTFRAVEHLLDASISQTTIPAADLPETQVPVVAEGRSLGEVTLVDKDGNEEVRTYEDCGCCDEDIPLVKGDIALVCLLLNIFIPGVGTMVGAYHNVSGYMGSTCCHGILQMLLTVVVAGTVWSIITGVRIYQKSQQVYGYDEVTIKTNTSTTDETSTSGEAGRRLVEDKKNI